jgi:t-SNARE complex subunit (syntaxin)
VSPVPFEDNALEIEKNLSMAEKAQEARRKYFKKSLIEYGFTEEQAELLLQSIDEFVTEEKDLTEEAKESLYKE